VCRVADIVGGPSLSPDGTTLAFSTVFDHGTDNEYWAVITVVAAGGEPKEVCRSKAHTLDPVWSKDGRWLFFPTYNTPPLKENKKEIWRVSVQGGAPKPLNIGLH
jgi:Tol biopolymer transport system component